MSQILTIIAGDDEGGAYAKAVMYMDMEEISSNDIAEFRTGVRAAYKASFGDEAKTVIVMLDDHVNEFVIPGYVARVAGTDHAESAHNTLNEAGSKAIKSGMSVMVCVTPDRHS